MKITNDRIEFDAADFDGLSDFARKALPVYVGERADFLVVLADTLNSQIEAAKESLVNATRSAESVDEVLNGLAAADQAKYDEALTAIRTVLGLPVAGTSAESESESQSIWTRLLSIFK